AFQDRCDDRSVTRDRDVDDHRIGTALHVDRPTHERCGLELSPVLVAARIGGILALDEQILRIRVRVREAPRDAVVVADDDPGYSGERKADELVARALEADLVPDRRVADREVWVAREDRFAGLGSRPSQSPAVRACALARAG